MDRNVDASAMTLRSVNAKELETDIVVVSPYTLFKR